MEISRKVNLFIVGAAKCGTTSMSDYLSGHNEICMSPIKEPNFFTWEEIQNQDLYYKGEIGVRNEVDYIALFSDCINTPILGEASVSYLYYTESAKKIKRYNPNSKIIILLRDPVKRAFSHYLMDKRLGYVKNDFSEIVTNKDKFPLHYQQYILLGMYYEQIKRYLDEFDEAQVLILLSDELKKETHKTINATLKFLGVSDPYEIETLKMLNASGEGKNALIRIIYRNRFLRKLIKGLLPGSMKSKVKNISFSQSSELLSSEMESQMRELFKDDLIKLESLIKKNLSAWYE